MIKCFEAHYPESLGICLVHKAPWVFQGIWVRPPILLLYQPTIINSSQSIIKGWLDPVVASKIHFTKTNEDLEAYIPRSQIIKELGGEEDWEYQYIEPSAGEDKALEDTESLARLQKERDAIVNEYEEITRAWITSTNGESDANKAKRTALAKKLETGYWSMDKHLRGRTIYDRTGVLGSNGELNFYPTKKAETHEETHADLD